jgi:hypothetical protein
VVVLGAVFGVFGGVGVGGVWGVGGWVVVGGWVGEWVGWVGWGGGGVWRDIANKPNTLPLGRSLFPSSV